MKNYFKKIVILISLIAILAVPYFVFAAGSDAYNNLQKVGSGDTNAPYMPINDTNSLAGVVGIVIQAFLGILGIIFLVLVIYAGFNWMTAQGEEEKVTKAKDTLQRAVIGLIITIAAYAISAWVFGKLFYGAANILK